MRVLSTLAIALCAAALAGCATNGGYSSPAVATSSKASWGPHGKPLYYFMVMSNAMPGKEEEFNRWYDHIHVPNIIEGGDFVSAQRFELSPKHFGGGTPALLTRQFLVIFAIETNDLEASLAEVNKRIPLRRDARRDLLAYDSTQSVS
jgi:hypothetical protein